MAHYIGKIDLTALLNVKVQDVEDEDGNLKKCIVIPIKDNDIKSWNGQLQLWFRAMAYRAPKGKMSHFIMKHVRIGDIKRMSAEQIEKFANHKIGEMRKTNKEDVE